MLGRFGPGLRRLAGAALCAVLALTATATAAAAGATRIDVHADRRAGPVNRALVGFDFHFGRVTPRAIASLAPRYVRLDASLEQISPAPEQLRLTDLQRRVASVRAIGGEPLVILDYTPRWLGQPLAPDPTKTEPRDLGVWRALIRRLVVALATGPGHVRWFEAWNEPDLPTFWAGTQAAWLDTAAASAHAVKDAAGQTQLRLRFGGPASFIPDSELIAAFVSRLHAEGLPPAFVSWHYYANYPCLGPDGPENPTDPSSVALQRALGCINPAASPQMYATGIDLVRSTIASASGSGPAPQLVLDEWNLSAGGLDRRMDSPEGAAFDTATLTTFQTDRLDAAAFYQAADTDPRPGGWGAVSSRGARRPSWWAFQLWQRLAPVRIDLTGDDPGGGLWAIASRDRRGRRLTVLLSSFSVSSPQARTISLGLLGLPRLSRGWAWRAWVRRLDATHAAPGARAPLPVGRSRRLTLALPAQAVAEVTVVASRRPRHTAAEGRGRRSGFR